MAYHVLDTALALEESAASGLSASQFQAAAARREKASYFSVTRTLRETCRAEGSRYLEIFGCAGKG
jgi:hypothetical protein